MTRSDLKLALDAATEAARAAGQLMRANLRSAKQINSATQHDIKLELDVRCQRLIQRRLKTAFPQFAFFGEEGTAGDPDAPARWVVDPIDGTVNFTYGVPHACVSIALQAAAQWQAVGEAPAARADARRPIHAARSARRAAKSESLGQRPQVATMATKADALSATVVGVVYDPFTEEVWTAMRGQPARLNGREVHVARRLRLAEAIVSLGFAKDRRSLRLMLPVFNALLPRVRKVRIMGAAALSLAYVACGRFDAYLEHGLRLWDIAAGGLLVECAGGEFRRRPLAAPHAYEIIAADSLLGDRLSRLLTGATERR